MWDDVIIGEGNRGNSAVHIFAINGDHRISENRVSYWISDAYLGLGMTIFKDTKVGKKLFEMIEKEQPLEEINSFLETTLLSKISAPKLKSAIDRSLRNSFDAGRESKAQEIRDALGL